MTTSPNVLAALRTLRAATTAFFDVLEMELRSGESLPITPSTATVKQALNTAAPDPAPRPVPRTPAPTGAASLNRHIEKKPLPKPATPGRKAEVPLTDKQLAEHLPEATRLAVDVLRALGGDANSPMAVEGLRGQLALNRVPTDSKLISDALAAAKAKLR